MRCVRQAAMIGLFVAMPMSAYGAPGPFTLGRYNQRYAVFMWYDPTDGNVSVKANDVTMTSFQMESASGQFIAANSDPGFCTGPFDVCTEQKMFTLRTDGVTELDLGPILPPGLAVDALLADLLVDGSLLPSGTLADAPGGGPYIPVPEPSALVLMLLGCTVIARRVRF